MYDNYLLQLSLQKYIMYETGELLEQERVRYDRVIHCRRLLSALHDHDILTLSKIVAKHGTCSCQCRPTLNPLRLNLPRLAQVALS